jgi:hypothetical protein
MVNNFFFGKFNIILLTTSYYLIDVCLIVYSIMTSFLATFIEVSRELNSILVSYSSNCFH